MALLEILLPAARRLSAAACALALCAGASAQLRAPAAPAAPAAGSPSQTAADQADKEDQGQRAAIAWLVLLDQGEWGAAWRESSALFRNSVPLEQWLDAAPKLRLPWGLPQQRVAHGAAYRNALPGRPAGDYVTASFVSSYSDNPEVEEIVTTVREADGNWRVSGYATR